MSQTSSRDGWNGGLGWWAVRQGRGFMNFALFIHSAQYAELCYYAFSAYFQRQKARPDPFFSVTPSSLTPSSHVAFGVLKSEKKFDPALHDA